MAGFKEAGKFIEPVPIVDEGLRPSGGIQFTKSGKGADFSIRHPHFRLRQNGDGVTINEISNNDIDPILIQPGDMKDIRVPEREDVTLGLETEFIVIDENGNLVDLYAGDELIVQNGHLGVNETGSPWLLDEIGLSPEALRFQGELAYKPAATWDDVELNILTEIAPVFSQLRARNLYLLPVGGSGEDLPNNFSNVSPSDYIGKIHTVSLRGTAKTFDKNTAQGHHYLKPFGPAETGIDFANNHNPLVATLDNAVSTNTPFDRGRITGYLSTREQGRQMLSTAASKGGVQGNMPLDAIWMLRGGDYRVRSAIDPVPERYPKAHGDTRAVKFTTATHEEGSRDMNGNIDSWIAFPIKAREHHIRVNQSRINGDPIPSVLVKVDYATRLRNRAEAGKYGPRAVLKTSRGYVGVRDAWDGFFDWLRPPERVDDWERSEQTIRRMLEPTKAADYGAYSYEMYYDSRRPDTYLVGNLAEVGQVFVNNIDGSQIQRIRQANAEHGKRFMNDLEIRLKNKGFIN